MAKNTAGYHYEVKKDVMDELLTDIKDVSISFIVNDQKETIDEEDEDNFAEIIALKNDGTVIKIASKLSHMDPGGVFSTDTFGFPNSYKYIEPTTINDDYSPRLLDLRGQFGIIDTNIQGVFPTNGGTIYWTADNNRFEGYMMQGGLSYAVITTPPTVADPDTAYIHKNIGSSLASGSRGFGSNLYKFAQAQGPGLTFGGQPATEDQRGNKLVLNTDAYLLSGGPTTGTTVNFVNEIIEIKNYLRGPTYSDDPSDVVTFTVPTTANMNKLKLKTFTADAGETVTYRIQSGTDNDPSGSSTDLVFGTISSSNVSGDLLDGVTLTAGSTYSIGLISSSASDTDIYYELEGTLELIKSIYMLEGFTITNVGNSNTSTFSSATTTTKNDFVSKLQTDLSTTITYGEDNDSNGDIRAYISFDNVTTTLEISGIPLSIFDETELRYTLGPKFNAGHRSVTLTPSANKIYFKTFTIPTNMTISDGTNSSSHDSGVTFVNIFVNKIQTDLSKTITYTGQENPDLMTFDITGGDISLTGLNETIFGVTSKTLTGGDNTLPLLTLREDGPDYPGMTNDVLDAPSVIAFEDNTYTIENTIGATANADGSLDKYDHIKLSVLANTTLTELNLTEITGTETVNYRIQAASAIDTTAGDTVTGSFTGSTGTPYNILGSTPLTGGVEPRIL
jgi:hypothetical protein